MSSEKKRNLPPSPARGGALTTSTDEYLGYLHIAEISHESGAIRLRYARRLAADGSRWIRHGRFVEYFESGQVKSDGEYVDGQEEGIWRDYHSNGRLAAEGLYAAGKEEGVWRFFAEDGRNEHSVVYRAGVEL